MTTKQTNLQQNNLISYFKGLESELVWQIFLEITQIPRPSGREAKIQQYLIDFAIKHKLAYKKTSIGNIIIQKNASLGMENRKKITMQVHMDMVTTKTIDSKHNFDTDPIITYIDGEWLKTKDTTLGADNGIGMAFALAVLASNNIQHGDLEVLITVDEEVGMLGAFELHADEISGDILLNLDSEDDDTVCIGSAGCGDVNVSVKLDKIKLSDIYNNAHNNSFKTIKVAIMGGQSGHSGLDIHLSRINAIKEMANLLYLLLIKHKLISGISHISGGKLRNVIPAYCEAHIVIKNQSDILNKVTALIQDFLTNLKLEFTYNEPNINITISELESNDELVFQHHDISKLITALTSCFNGLYRMDWKLNIPHTSSNIGVISYDEATNTMHIKTMQRSAEASALKKISQSIISTFELINATIIQGKASSCWTPQLNSEMLSIVTQRYKALFNEEMKVSATHGGLECGLIVALKPSLDAISIGSTIKHAHSPREQLLIPSVNKIWLLLRDLLINTPIKNQL